jgi:hypothetical protein
MIPPRPPYPIKVNSAEKAIDDYHQQIQKVAGLVLAEYRCVDDRHTCMCSTRCLVFDLEKFATMIHQ